MGRMLAAVVAVVVPTALGAPAATVLSLEGVHVVPHRQSAEMQYRRKADFSLGARVEVYLRNASATAVEIPASAEVRVRNRTRSTCWRRTSGPGMTCRRPGAAHRCACRRER